MLIKEALEKAESDAHHVRLEAVKEAAEAVAAHYAAQAEAQKEVHEVAKGQAVDEAVRQARAEEQAQGDTERAALLDTHAKALENQKAIDDAAVQMAIEKTKAEMRTEYGRSDTGKQVVEAAVAVAMGQAEGDEKARAGLAQQKAEAEKEAAVATAINKTVAEQMVRTKSAVARAVAEAELRFAEVAQREQAEAVRKTEQRMAEATRLQCVTEFEDKMALMRDELAAQARKAQLKDQMLDAVMADKHPPQLPCTTAPSAPVTQGEAFTLGEDPGDEDQREEGQGHPHP